jgi:hypothetical protein
MNQLISLYSDKIRWIPAHFRKKAGMMVGSAGGWEIATQKQKPAEAGFCLKL